MNRRNLTITIVLLLLALASFAVVYADGQSDLAQVRAATARFQRSEVAQEAGWDLVPGLDHCFDNPGVGAMGYHYIDAASLDANVDGLRPEAMVYAPGPNGQLQLGAVEYIVPADPWHEAGNIDLPSVLGQEFHLNESLGVYVLHAWIWQNNPSGIFESWNPTVTCP